VETKKQKHQKRQKVSAAFAHFAFIAFFVFFWYFGFANIGNERLADESNKKHNRTASTSALAFPLVGESIGMDGFIRFALHPYASQCDVIKEMCR
jgi:hypothetical protein